MSPDDKKPVALSAKPAVELLAAQFVDEHAKEFSTHVEGCTCWTCPWFRKFKEALK